MNTSPSGTTAAVPINQLELTEEERDALLTLARRRSSPRRLVARARIVLAIAGGRTPTEVAQEEGTTRAMIYKWVRRFREQRIAGLEREAPGRGRKPSIHVEDIVRKTQEKPPASTHWSRRTMADAAGVSPSSVGRVWRAHGLTPPDVRRFKTKTPLADVIALYLDPPVKAIVIIIDKGARVPALGASQPGVSPIQAATARGERRRATLFAALKDASCKLPNGWLVWPRSPEFLDFLRKIETSVDGSNDLHVLIDEYARYQHRAMDRWLLRHARVRLARVPPRSSWVDVTERLLNGLAERGLRHGSFGHIPALVAALKEYLAHVDERSRPFAWAAQARVR